MQTLPEPSPILFLAQNCAVWIVPFFAYFLGIYIRKRVFPGDNSPELSDQMWLGVPVCLVVVSPMISALRESIGSHVPTYLFTIGIIMEHGMIVHETAAKHVKERLQAARGIR